jgi:hypothetical protein
VLHVDPVGLGQKIKEGFVVEEFPQVPAHLRGEGQLAVTVGPGAAPAAEHVRGAFPSAIPDAFPLLEKKDAFCIPLCQRQGRKDTGGTAADDDDLVFVHVPPLSGWSLPPHLICTDRARVRASRSGHSLVT